MRHVRVAVFLVAVFSQIQSAAAINGTPSWFESRIATVPSGFYVSSPSLAFDHYGTPSVSWSQVETTPGTNTVRHSHFLGLGLWSTRDVASGSGSGMLTSLAFDRSERPMIAWVNSNGTVQGSFNGGAAQSIGTDALTTTPSIDITYDLTGTLHGMYGRTTAGNFFDIRHTGGTFSSSDMTTLPGVLTVIDAAMAVDGRGLRHVAARTNLSGGNQGLVIASQPLFGGTWPSATLATASNVTGVDIAVNPNSGLAALAYTTYDSGTNTSKLFYTRFTGFALETTELQSSTGHRFEDVSLAFDLSDGLPAIAYERKVISSSAEELWLAYTNNGTSWLTSLVDGTIKMDAPAGRPRRPSLAFDDYGTSWPAIAYVDADGGLNVAFDPPVPEPSALALLAILLGARRRRPSRQMI